MTVWMRRRVFIFISFSLLTKLTFIFSSTGEGGEPRGSNWSGWRRSLQQNMAKERPMEEKVGIRCYRSGWHPLCSNWHLCRNHYIDTKFYREMMVIGPPGPCRWYDRLLSEYQIEHRSTSEGKHKHQVKELMVALKVISSIECLYIGRELETMYWYDFVSIRRETKPWSAFSPKRVSDKMLPRR